MILEGNKKTEIIQDIDTDDKGAVVMIDTDVYEEETERNGEKKIHEFDVI